MCSFLRHVCVPLFITPIDFIAFFFIFYSIVISPLTRSFHLPWQNFLTRFSRKAYLFTNVVIKNFLYNFTLTPFMWDCRAGGKATKIQVCNLKNYDAHFSWNTTCLPYGLAWVYLGAKQEIPFSSNFIFSYHTRRRWQSLTLVKKNIKKTSESWVGFRAGRVL